MATKRKTKETEVPADVVEEVDEPSVNGAHEPEPGEEPVADIPSEPPDMTIRPGIWVDINRLSIDEWEQMEEARASLADETSNADMRRALRPWIEKCIVVDEAEADPPQVGMRDFLRAFWRFLAAYAYEATYRKN